MTTSLSHIGAVVGDAACASRRPRRPTSSPFGALARPFRYSNVVSSGAIRPALAPASIDMLHTVMRPSIDSARMAEPRYSMTWPMPPPVPMSPMIARMTSFAVTPAGSSPSTVDRHPLRPRLRQGLGGEHVLDLAGADAEGERAERAVGGGVAVAAHDRHARQGAALLGADDVHDALAGIAHREVGDAELGGVLAQHLDLAWPRSGRRSAGRCARSGRCGPRWRSVRSGRRTRAAAEPQPVERLRAGDLVDEVQVDVQQVGFVGCGVHHVAFPHLLRQCLCRMSTGSLVSIPTI